MTSNEKAVSRRTALKGVATGAALGLGAVAGSSTAAADDCQYVYTCGARCYEGVWVYKYECCDGEAFPDECTLVSEYCGMCP